VSEEGTLVRNKTDCAPAGVKYLGVRVHSWRMENKCRGLKEGERDAWWIEEDAATVTSP